MFTESFTSLMMGRQIRFSITMSNSTNEKMWYKKHKDAPPERANCVMQRGHDMALINKNLFARLIFDPADS